MDERVSYILKHPATLPTAVGVVSFGIGLGLGYICGKEKGRMSHEVNESFSPVEDMGFDEAFEELRQRLDISEDEGVSDFDGEIEVPPGPSSMMDAEQYRALVSKQEESDDDDSDILAEEIENSVIDHQIPDEPVELEKNNIFAHSGDDWDYEEELAKRSDTEPYILHKDEFWAEEKDYAQMTLTYYAQDNILADEDDVPIYNHDRLTGPLLFGHGSGDSDTVYIRNDSRHAEYEILRVNGAFSVEVMGLEIEDNQRIKNLRHSSSVPKFRPDD